MSIIFIYVEITEPWRSEKVVLSLLVLFVLAWVAAAQHPLLSIMSTITPLMQKCYHSRGLELKTTKVYSFLYRSAMKASYHAIYFLFMFTKWNKQLTICTYRYPVVVTFPYCSSRSLFHNTLNCEVKVKLPENHLKHFEIWFSFFNSDTAKTI